MIDYCYEEVKDGVKFAIGPLETYLLLSKDAS